MPTVHLSLPEQTYRELKERAGELGIQITDLVKLYIKMGLEKGFTSRGGDEAFQAVATLSRKVDRLERDYRVKFTLLEGKYRQIEEALNYIIERVELLEEAIAEVRTRKLKGEVFEEAG